ncbi:MAG: hypothetical protein NC489_39580 [Ruminococcus flavefaciens]|nr:hypothetical protein [Ruminococcus flavefaciens]
MAQQTEEEKGVPCLDISSISDIHYDDTRSFGASIHKEIYKNAIRITQEIAEDAKRQSGHERGTGLRNKEQLCNIIFFTGDKGTGKTSTMLSYMEFLKDYYRNKSGNDITKEFMIGTDEKTEYMFTGIEYIDASSLNDKEDILGDVLAKMLSKWRNEEQNGQRENAGIVRNSDYDYKKRQLRLQFSEIYERLKESKNKEEILQRDNDMFIEAIESLSFSGNVKKSFQKLVEGYLDIMVYPKSDGKIPPENHYLVISIDDLDMNVQSGFLLLEQIRKYLMVPRVLVLMSANYEQLEKICYNHYWREFKEIGKNPENKLYIQKISMEYLEKMIPFQRQVELMPNKKWEYYSEKQLKIISAAKDTSQEKKFNMSGTLCEIVSDCMKRYFDVRFTMDERCIGYLAPNTVRETANWAYQIKNLTDLGTKDVDLSDAYERNAHWFLTKEFPRLCRKYLTVDLQKILNNMEELNPEEQISKIVSTINRKTGTKDKGSWLRSLEKARQADKELRDFSYLCLIYFNVKLRGIAINICSDKKDAKQKEAKAFLIRYYSVMERGIWGSWEDKMIVLRDNNTIRPKDFMLVNIARTHFSADNKELAWELKTRVDPKQKKDFYAYLEDNKEKILQYQFYLLFFNLKATQEEIFKFDMQNMKIALPENCSGVFSLTGFVLNVLEGAPLLKQFQNMLLEKFKKYKITDVEQKNLRTKLFFEPQEELLLPIYDIDFMIGVGLRLQKELGYPAQGTLDEDNIIGHIKNFFSVIHNCLTEYNSEMAENFIKFRPVRKIREQTKEFSGPLAKGIMSLAKPYPISVESDEWTGVSSI